MPIPTPESNENQDDFLARCIPQLIDEGETPDVAQAICFTQWEENKEAMNIPTFETKEALIDHLVKNKNFLIAQKMSALKHADSIHFHISKVNDEGETEVVKASSGSSLMDADTLKLQLVINTTNIMDSHRDVHIKGLWTKTLQEQKNLYLLQEHKMEFDKIITDKVKAKTVNMNWSDLGYTYKGQTQALVFTAEISKDRNPFMFEQYAKGYVKNHSVGMRYVKIALASNDDRYPEEVAVWNKYIDQVANKAEVEENGYFWAVTEAKMIEGSAVPLGSNQATPTLSVESKNIEPESSTQAEPPNSTQNNDQRKGSSVYFY